MRLARSQEIIRKITRRNLIPRSIIFVLALFVSAVGFNLFYAPQNFVTGGVTGLALIFNKLCDINISQFVLFGNLFFIGLSLIFLGGKSSIKNIIGALIFSGFILLTANITNYIKLDFDNKLLYAIAGALIQGITSGLVFKVGFSSGGTDILGMIFSSRFHLPLGKTMFVVSFIIIFGGTFVFGFEMLMYAVIIKYIESFITDKILLGISDSKMFLIQSEKEEEIKDFIFENIKSGVTLLNAVGAYTKNKTELIMCIVPTEKYIGLKDAINEIDSNAFIIVSDCYEVLGGTKRKKNPITKYING
ncbi:MAG: YitT family protein [Bacilli bacterium]